MSEIINLPLKSKNGICFKYEFNENMNILLQDITDIYYNLQVKPFNLVYEYEALSNCSLDNGSSTLPDTLRLLEKGRVEKKKENTILNTLNILRLGLLEDTKIDKQGVITIWKSLTKNALSNRLLGINTQGYRRTSVYLKTKGDVISYIPPSAEKVERLMDDLYSYLNTSSENPLIKAIVFHFYFVYVHPFCDGNGRTSRLLLNKILIDSGLEKFRYISITSEVKKDTTNYNEILKRCETDKRYIITPFIIFYLEKIKEVLLNLRDGIFVQGIDTTIERSLSLISIEKHLRITHHHSTDKELAYYLNTHGFRLTLKECRVVIQEGLKLGTIIQGANYIEPRYSFNYNKRR